MDELFDVFEEEVAPIKVPTENGTLRKEKNKKRLANGEAKDADASTNGGLDSPMPDANGGDDYASEWRSSTQS